MKLFISYSHNDKDFATKLYNTLVYSHLDVFIDEKDIKIGDNILERIEKGIEESAGLLYVISKSSVKSTWVREELSMARVKSITQRGIFTIYPLLIDDVELPVSISQLRYADFREWRVTEKYYSIISQLLTSLGVKETTINQGQIEFVASNFTLLIALIQSLKIVTGLAEGALDFFFFVKPRYSMYGASAGDVTHRFEKMSRNMGGNLSFLLDSLQKILTERDFESRDLLLQMVNECSKNLSSLHGYNEDTGLFPLAVNSFTQLSKTLNDLLNDFNRETNVLIYNK